MSAVKKVREKSAPAARISWENILTSLEEGVVVSDLQGRISFFNQSAEVLTELPASLALGQPYASVFAKSPWENILTSLEEGVVVIDLQGRIAFFNQSAEVLTKLPASLALGQPYASDASSSVSTSALW